MISDSDDDDSGFTFGGKITKTNTQITSIANMPKAQTFVIAEATKNVKTQPTGNIISKSLLIILLVLVLKLTQLI